MQSVSEADMVALAEWLTSLNGPSAKEVVIEASERLSLETAVEDKTSAKPTVVPKPTTVLIPQEVIREAISLNGEALYTSRGCVACHGADAKTPLTLNYPQIAGQSYAYLVTQMVNIKSETRENGQTAAMKPFMASVSEDEIVAMAVWLASLAVDEGTAGDPTLMAEGEKLYKSENTNCITCHGTDANTPLRSEHFPKLAAQNKDYMIAQMKDIKSGTRDNANSAAMAGVMQSVSEADMVALAEWLASLNGPSVTKKAVIKSTPDIPEAISKIQSILKPIIAPKQDGATLYNEKGCVACHGSEGKMPILLAYPKLAGQNLDYALVQLKDIKSGVRNNGQSVVMKGIMQGVNEEEMTLIAQWLTSLPQEHGVATDATLADQGAKLYNDKTCVACHGKDAQTPIMSIYPKLAGQNPDYVIAQMKDIKSGARHNGLTVIMKGVMQMVSDEEIEAIAQWLVSPTEIKKK